MVKEGGLEGFGEFFGEGAVRTAVAGLFAAGRLVAAAARGTLFVSGVLLRSVARRWAAGSSLALRLRRLRWIRTKQTIFERRTIEAADDRIHLFGVRRFDERESLRLLRFRIADHFNRVRDEAFGGEPAPDVVR